MLDALGAVIPAAKVSAKNIDAGIVSDTTSTETANYTLPSLPAGNYEVSAEAAGFKREIRSGVQVQVAGTVRVDLRLEGDSTRDSIIINAESTLLKTESAEQSLTGELRYPRPGSFRHRLTSQNSTLSAT